MPKLQNQYIQNIFEIYQITPCVLLIQIQL